MPSSCSEGSERDLRPGQESLLLRAVAGGRAAVERGLLVVQDVLDVPVQVPVQARCPRLGLAGRLRDVRESSGERPVLHLELVEPRRKLELPPLPLAGVEGLRRLDRRPAGLAPREEEGGGRLPGLGLDAPGYAPL